MAGGGRRYPLEAARDLRGHAVSEAEAALAHAVASVREAEQGVLVARKALGDHMAQSRREALEIGRREDAGGSAAELARGDAFRARRGHEREALAARVRAAEVTRDERAREAEAARGRLGEARAEQEVVERHHERFLGAEKKARDAREEAEAEDLAAARRHRSSE